MTALLASLILLHAPSLAPEDPEPGGSGSGTYALIDYSPEPEGIGATIQGTNVPVSAASQFFYHDIVITDKDTYKKSTTGEEVVKGTPPLLDFVVDSDNGYIGGSSTAHIFVKTAVDDSSSKDDAVTKEVSYTITPVSNLQYPVQSQCQYIVTDPASSAPHVPYGGHCKDTPGKTVSRTVTVTS